VLIVEDEEDIRELLSYTLIRDGYQVATVASGEEALAVAEAKTPDLVLLDLMLPGVDGAEVLMRKQKDPAIMHIPVIAVTALSSPFDQIMWKRRTEIRDYLTKPFKRQELLDMVDRVLAGQIGEKGDGAELTT
jgi:DNA-binding response OmpR family regulator